MKPFIFCQKYLKQHKLQLTAYVIITLASTAVAILSPYIIGTFLDNLIEGADIGVILHFCIIFGGLNLLRIIKNYVVSIMYVKMSAQMSYDLNMDVTKHIQKLSLSYINSKDIAYLSQRVSSDSGSLIGFCITILQSVLTNAVMLVVPFVLLLTMNWMIAVLLISFLIVYVAVYFVFKRPLYNAGLAFRESQGKFFSGLFEQLKLIKLIKVNSIQPQINKRADEVFADFKKKSVHNQKVSYLYSGLDGIVSTVAQILLFVVGGLQVLAGNFTIGMFTIFTSYFNMMLGSSRYFFGLGASYQHTLVSHDRISSIMDLEPESHGVKVIDDVNEIELRDLSFSYTEISPESVEIYSADDLNTLSALCDIPSELAASTKKVITNISTTFKKGKMYAVYGSNGAGKSTLINLIMGLYINEYDGQILYDGADIRHIDMTSVRRNILGFAEQEPTLIKDSIWYNLKFQDVSTADMNISTSSNTSIGTDVNKDKALDKHIQTLGMQDFVSRNSLDFSINEDSTNTSGGEKQKISILKVLYKNPTVMIFDEPTSALDVDTTKRFIEYLQYVKKDKIIIVITHDGYIKGCCDEIVRMSQPE